MIQVHTGKRALVQSGSSVYSRMFFGLETRIDKVEKVDLYYLTFLKINSNTVFTSLLCSGCLLD